jgi:hypothetical protein
MIFEIVFIIFYNHFITFFFLSYDFVALFSHVLKSGLLKLPLEMVMTSLLHLMPSSLFDKKQINNYLWFECALMTFWL